MAEGRDDTKGRASYPAEFHVQVAEFFTTRTHIVSGANTKVRRLLITKERLEVEFHAEFPEILRKAARADPDMLPDSNAGTSKLTRMHQNLLAAQLAAEKPGFTQSAEYLERLNAELNRRLMFKVREHLRKRGLSPPLPPSTKASAHTIVPPTTKTLWKLIQQSGIAYTCKSKPHSCPLHHQGPIWELQLKEINSKLAADPSPDPAMYQKLLAKARKLKSDVTRYERHLEQYAKCRATVKGLEESLVFGDRRCVLYRDFVNMYNDRGTKIKNLVLVKITRAEDGSLLVVKLHGFCSDKQVGCDAYYVADVMDFHMKSVAEGGSGQFDDVDEIFQSGDHGPHFACNETVYNESCFFNKYGKTLHDLFLCSYHAYNRCDGDYSNIPLITLNHLIT
jgi:hypothetical protein